MRIRVAKLITVFVVLLNFIAVYFIWKLLSSHGKFKISIKTAIQSSTIVNEQVILKRSKKLPFQNEVTFVIRSFEEFDHDIVDTVKSVLSVYANASVLIVTDKPLYPPIILNTSLTTSNVKFLNLKVRLANAFKDRTPILQLNKKYILFIPDSTRLNSKKLLDKLVNISNKEPDKIIAVPYKGSKAGGVKCLKTYLDTREWIVRFEELPYIKVCDYIKGKHALFIKMRNLLQMPDPFMLPFPDSLYLQSTSKNIKVMLANELVLNNGKELFKSHHNQWKAQQADRDRQKTMFHSLELKKVIRENGVIEWFGCRRDTPRCFPSVIDDTPQYLWEGKWTPPCCLAGLRRTARHVFEQLEEAKVRYWLEGGSLLGAMRGGDILPWDYDVDIGIYREDITKCTWLLRADNKPITDQQGFVWEKAIEDGKHENVSGCGLTFLHFRALIYKRFLTRMRTWISSLIFMVLPILLMAYTMTRTMEENNTTNQPSLLISLQSFPGVHVAVSSDNSTVTSLLQQAVSSGQATYDTILPGTSFDNYFGKQINGSLVEYERQLIAGFLWNSTSFIGGYSTYFVHSSVLVLNMLANILLQLVSPSSSITVYNHPIVVQTSEDICDLALRAQLHVFLFPMVMTFLSLGLLILAMNFISFPLKERVSNSKQLQLMTGVSPLLYWITNFLCDYIFYVITAGFMVASVFVFQHHNIYSNSGYIGTVIAVFMLFGISGMAYAYFFSFLFKSSVHASAVFTMINTITGTIAAVFLVLVSSASPDYNIYIFIFSFNPIFAVTSAFCYLFAAMYLNGVCIQCGQDICTLQDPLQFHETGSMSKNPYGIYNFLIFLAVDAVIYFSLVMIIEYGLMKKLWFFLTKIWIKMDDESVEEDADVLIEKNKVRSLQNLRGYTNNMAVLCVNDLGKKYKRKATAVHGVTFQVAQGECFGLLGVNGAGKTTTFKMLTGEEIPNKGDATVLQHSLQRQKSKFLSKIGYCPQFDAINKLLTGREMLRVYALLRGIPSAYCDSEVSRWIQIMGLKEYADRPCGTYSGGNKRKLSTAMAFIGEPPVVFLDEPTSGVDPVSRRKLWDVMATCQQAGQAVVLTSHSMEECEALCSRLTIMVAGQMKCIGSTQYLKHKFGQGYTIKIKLISSQQLQNAQSMLKYDMASHFRGCAIKDEHMGLLHYHVPDPTIRLSELFTKMEQLKRRHDIIEDYIVSDTSLEEVFMSFAQAGSSALP